MKKLIFLFVLFPYWIFGQSANYDNIHFSGLVPSVTTNKAYANPAHHFYWNGFRIDSVYSASTNYQTEIATDAQNNLSVSFVLASTTSIFYNSTPLQSSQWSGIGTTILTISLDTKQYDKVHLIK